MEKRDGFRGSLMTVLPQEKINEWANNSFTKDLFITHIGYFPHAEHHFRQREEGLDEFVLLCCTEGKGWIKYSDQMIGLEKGKAFIIPAGFSHSYGADIEDPWTIYWLHFKGDKAGESASALSGIIPFRRGSGQISPVMLFKDMLAEFEDEPSGKYVSAILHHLLESLTHQKDNERKESVKNPVVEKCKLFLNRNLGRDISLDEIVRESGVSTTQCANLFRKYTGLTPVAFLTQLRIEEACRLLELTSLKIKEISAMVGIIDPYYFSRLISKHLGMSPQQYRSRLNQE